MPLDHLSRSPENLDLVSAAALPTVGTTAITAVRDVARVREGDRLLVRGASGGVGSVAVQLGHAFGARVTGLASGRNLDLVTDLGPMRRSTTARRDPLTSACSTSSSTPRAVS